MPPAGQKKSKTALIVTIIILVILGISASIVGYYLYTIKDLTPDDSKADSLDPSTLCFDIVAMEKTADAPYVLIPSSTKQDKDLAVEATNSFYAIYNEIPSTFANTDYTDLSFTVNGTSYDAVKKTYEELDAKERTALEEYATGANIPVSKYLTATFGYIEDSSEFIDSSSLNIIAQADISSPSGDETASCGAIFVTNSSTINPDDPDPVDPDPVDPDPTDPDPVDPDPTDPDPVDPDPNNGGGDTDNVTSSLVLTIAGDVTCVERISGSNAARITITIRNSDTDPELVTRLLNKLPLGFNYKANTTYVNGVAYADSNLDIITTGSTSELNWEPASPWTLAAGQTMTVRFDVIAGSGALSGANQNEAIVTPLNSPVDPSTLRSTLAITVAQSCTSPQTGLFDSIAGRIAVSIFLIVVAAVFYYSSASEQVSANLLTTASNSPINRGFKAISDQFRMLSLKLTHPRRYFEEQISRKARPSKRK